MGCSPSPSVSGRGSPDVPPWRQNGDATGRSPLPSERLRRVVRDTRAQLATFSFRHAAPLRGVCG